MHQVRGGRPELSLFENIREKVHDGVAKSYPAYRSLETDSHDKLREGISYIRTLGPRLSPNISSLRNDRSTWTYRLRSHLQHHKGDFAFPKRNVGLYF